MTASSPLLLDTCAAIWFADDLPMANAAINAMNEAFAENVSAYVSPISAWEIGILCARGRMRFPVPPQSWFKRLRSFEGIALVDLSPEILVASSFLPGDPPPILPTVSWPPPRANTVTRWSRVTGHC